VRIISPPPLGAHCIVTSQVWNCDTGPSNPLPQDVREEAIFAQQKVLNEANEYFEELKKDEQEKREEREAAWAEQELSVKEKEETRLERKREGDVRLRGRSCGCRVSPPILPHKPLQVIIIKLLD